MKSKGLYFHVLAPDSHQDLFRVSEKKVFVQSVLLKPQKRFGGIFWERKSSTGFKFVWFRYKKPYSCGNYWIWDAKSSLMTANNGLFRPLGPDTRHTLDVTGSRLEKVDIKPTTIYSTAALLRSHQVARHHPAEPYV